MNCPSCDQPVNETKDQFAAMTAAVVPVLAASLPGILGMVALIYLWPALVAGLLWLIFRTVACPYCKRRFAWWQSGSK